MEGQRQRVVGNGLVRAPPLRWAKDGISNRELDKDISRLLGSSGDAARHCHSSPLSSSLAGEDSLDPSRPDPDRSNGCDDPLAIRLGRSRRDRRSSQRMVNVSWPFEFGLGCGTGGTSLGHVTLRLCKVDVAGAVKTSTDFGYGGDSNDDDTGVHLPPSKWIRSWKNRVARTPQQRRLRRKGEARGGRTGSKKRPTHFRRGLCRVSQSTCGILNAACVLLSTKAFFPRLARRLCSWVAAAGIGQWAFRYLGMGNGHSFRNFQESEGGKHETVWGGMAWPQRVEEFSIASIALSLAVPFLQWRFPSIHHALKCGGAAIPVMAGYAHTENLVRGQPAGATGEGEKLWRERHRWAAERLCHLLTDFSEKPALGWLVALAHASSVVVELAEAAIPAKDAGAGTVGWDSGMYGGDDLLGFHPMGWSDGCCSHTSDAAWRVWGSISLPSPKPSTQCTSAQSQSARSSAEDQGSLLHELQQSHSDDAHEIVSDRSQPSSSRQILPTVAGRLLNLLFLSAVTTVMPSLCMRNAGSSPPFVPLQSFSPHQLKSKEGSLSSKLSLLGIEEEPPLSRWQTSLPLLSQILWFSSLWALSSLQARRASSPSSSPSPSSLSPSLLPSTSRVPMPMPLPPSSSSSSLVGPPSSQASRNGNGEFHRLSWGTGRGFRLTIDFGRGRFWILTIPDWTSSVGFQGRNWLGSLRRSFSQSVEGLRWRGRVIDTDAANQGWEGGGMSIVQCAQEGFDHLLQMYFLFLRAMWLMFVFSPLFTLLPFLYFVSCYLEESRGRSLRSAIWILLRFCLEKGGAAFIKWAQWSATRQDLFPEDLCECLSRLHDRAPTHSLRDTRREIKRHLGHPIEELFDDFGERPVASGSIAQVHRAVLKDRGDGMPRDVAVKVRHPNVALEIRQDFKIMKTVANLLHRLPVFRGLNLQQSLQQFSHTMTAQTDLRVEAQNLERFYNNFLGLHQSVVPPRLIPDLVSEGVIVETFERGSALHEFLSHRSSLGPQIAAVGLDTFLKMMLVDNFVHLDLHPGNIIARVADDGAASDKERLQLVLLDFGMAEELTPAVRTNFISFIMMIGAGDGRRAAEYLLRWADPDPQTCQSPSELVNDMKALFDRECQLKRGPIDLNEVLKQVLCLARKHDVTINSSYASLVVSVCILSGFSHSLDPDLSIMDAAVPCLFTHNLTGLVLGRIYG